MRPDPSWESSGVETAINTFETLADELTISVWGGDWCKDCQEQLPAFAAALQTAGIDPEETRHFPVEKNDDGSKDGPLVEKYDITLIPTIVVERDGTEIARFVESAANPAIVELAEQLSLSTNAAQRHH